MIQIGGSSLQNGDTPASGNTLWLDQTDGNGNLAGPDFFSTGGFGSFTLNGLGQAVVDAHGSPVLDAAGNPRFDPAILIAPGTALAPVAQGWRVAGGGAALSLVSATLPLPSERTPVKLNFNAAGVTDSQNNGQLSSGAISSSAPEPPSSPIRWEA